MVFQPSLSSGLGNTVAQLLAEMNMGGNGGMGGYSMIGLYGGLPEMFGGKEGQMSDSAAGWMGRGTGRGLKPQGENPDAANAGETFAPAPPPAPARVPSPSAIAARWGNTSNASRKRREKAGGEYRPAPRNHVKSKGPRK